ncbi:MAG TPA: hypothetical protein VIZ86_01995 [Pseudomonas sp.]
MAASLVRVLDRQDSSASFLYLKIIKFDLNILFSFIAFSNALIGGHWRKIGRTPLPLRKIQQLRAIVREKQPNGGLCEIGTLAAITLSTPQTVAIRTSSDREPP